MSHSITTICPECTANIPPWEEKRNLVLPCSKCSLQVWHMQCYTLFLMKKRENVCPTCSNYLLVSAKTTTLFSNYERLRAKAGSRFRAWSLRFVFLMLFISAFLLCYYGAKRIGYMLNKDVMENLVKLVPLNWSREDTTLVTSELFGICVGTGSQKQDPLWYFNDVSNEWCIDSSPGLSGNTTNYGVPLLFFDSLTSPFITSGEVILILSFSAIVYLVIYGFIEWRRWWQWSSGMSVLSNTNKKKETASESISENGEDLANTELVGGRHWRRKRKKTPKLGSDKIMKRIAEVVNVLQSNTALTGASVIVDADILKDKEVEINLEDNQNVDGDLASTSSSEDSDDEEDDEDESGDTLL